MNKLWAVAILALPLAARAQETSAGAEAAAAPVSAAPASAPAPAKNIAEQRKDLQHMAEIIATDFTDEQWADSMAKTGLKNMPQSRRDALRGIYDKLAELDYKESLEKGADQKQAQAGLQAVETGSEIDTGWLSNWATNVYNGLGQSSVGTRTSTWHGTAVAAVRGGRAVSSDDPEVAGMQDQLTKVGLSLDDASLPQDKRAQLLLERGDLYRKLAQAAHEGDERSRWLLTAQLIGEQFTDESWKSTIDANPEAKGKFPASRTEALRLCYAKLAELDYQDALKAGPAVEEKPQVQAALQTVNAGAPIETGWRDWANRVLTEGHTHVYTRPTAVAAVRGGRSITASDAELQDVAAQMEQVDGKLQDAALTPEKRADLLYKRGRLFDRMAVGSQPAAAAAQLSPKEIYEKDSPAVVVIVAMGKDGVGELGTGSIIDKDGRVLTNAHVVTRDSDQQPYETIRIFLKPAQITGDNKKDLRDPIAVRVARFDRALDLALLEPEKPYTVPGTIAFGASAGVEPGEPVVAIGHPEQGGLWTLTTGVVSTTLADLGGVPGKDVFQTDASINRGNSGGPLLNRSGAMIGINTSMARKASDGLTITSVNFSIKSAVAQAWLAGNGETPTAASDTSAVQPAAPAESAPIAPVESAPIARAEPVKAQAKPAAEKPAIVTPAKPYRVENVLDDQKKAMQDMEDLETEMRNDVEKRARQLNSNGE